MSVIDRIRKLQHHRGELAFSDERYDLNKARRARNPTKKKWYLHEAHEDHIWGQRRIRASRKRGFL